MESALAGKRLLFVAPHFFGYEDQIAEGLKRHGAEVDALPDRPFDSVFLKGVTRIERRPILRSADRFYWQAIKKLARGSYDIMLVVNGEALSPSLLGRLRSEYPRATFVLYMWDSFLNRTCLLENIKFFDRCLTFNPDDASRFGMQFRPLFFTPDFERVGRSNPQYQLSFVGTAHSDRYALVMKVAEQLRKDQVFFRYLYLQAKWLFWIYRLFNRNFRGALPHEFKYVPMPKSEVLSTFFRSLAVLDIEHPKQRGLTIRTLEALGAGRKLITTNGLVRNYDFFTEANILIIDRSRLSIDNSFFDSPYERIDPAVYDRYRLRTWICDVLGISPGQN